MVIKLIKRTYDIARYEEEHRKAHDKSHDFFTGAEACEVTRVLVGFLWVVILTVGRGLYY